MATENSKYDPLRNPEVDYDRSDLSARGVVLFLLGLLVAGIFIELVLWGMFRFMAKSDVLFPQSQPNPMMSARKLAPTPPAGRCCRTLPRWTSRSFRSRVCKPEMRLTWTSFCIRSRRR